MSDQPKLGDRSTAIELISNTLLRLGFITAPSDIFDENKSKEMSKAEYLNIKLERAIEMEDFEEAVKLRDQIKNLETNQEEIQKLELELKESIKEQNFEKSIEIRDQLRKLRS